MSTTVVTATNTATMSPRAIGAFSISPVTTSPSVTESLVGDFRPRASIWLSYYVGFLSVTNIVVIIPTARHYAETLGADETFSGLAISLTPFFTVVGICMNKWMLRFASMRTVLFFMASGSVLRNSLYGLGGLTRSKWSILIGRSIIGLCAAAGIPTLYISQAVKIEERSKALFNYQFACVGGYIVGPIIAWGLEDFMKEIRYENLILDSCTIPGWFMAFVYFLLLSKVFVFFENPHPTPPTISTPDSLDVPSLPLRAVLTCFWLICAATICNSMLEVYLAKVAAEYWQWSIRVVSLYLAAVSSVLLPVCLFAGELTSLVQDRKGVMMVTPVGIVFSFLLLNFGLGSIGDVAVLTLASIFLLTVATVTKPFVMSVVTKIVPPHLKGFSSTLAMCFLYLGRGIGAMLGSVMQPWSVALTHIGLFGSMAMLTAASYSDLRNHTMAS